MLNLPRRIRRRLASLAILGLIGLSIAYVILPPDSSIRLALNFNTQRVTNTIWDAAHDRDAWLRTSVAPYQIDLSTDVGYLIKTGYGTRHRVPLQLEALKQSGNLLGEEGKGFLVVGDWTTVNESDAREIGVPVHDVLKLFWENDALKGEKKHSRQGQYRTLQSAVENGDEATAQEIGRRVGWELDCLKFTAGMELLFHKLPNKKWYMILDDDTFLVKATLELLLTHLNPKLPHYIGNAVGDYRGRFAHGGSGILLSGEALARLFRQPRLVTQSYRNSLEETWGDRLVATTLQKLGIFLEERYSHHFNGEPPELARISADRMCSPILSFHSLRTATAMGAISHAIGRSSKPILWSELLDIFGMGATESAGRKGRDHVGPLGENEHTKTRTETRRGVQTASACRKICNTDSHRWCLAWTFDENKGDCYMSPWVVPGSDDDAANMVSGVNDVLLRQLRSGCP